MADGANNPSKIAASGATISERECPKMHYSRTPECLALAILLLVVATGPAGCGRKPVATKADYSEAHSVSVILGDPVEENGLVLVETDKKFRGSAEKIEGSKCRRFKHPGTNEGYIYFQVDPSFKRRGLSNVTVTAEFFDSSYGSLEIQYDGNETDMPDRSEKGQLGLIVYQHGEYTPGEEKVQMTKKSYWQAVTFNLKDVRFKNSQHGNADFRLKVSAPEIILRKVTLQTEQPQL